MEEKLGKTFKSFLNLNNYNFMGICLFCYERRSTAPTRESDINLHYEIFLCAFPSFPSRIFSSTAYVEITENL